MAADQRIGREVERVAGQPLNGIGTGRSRTDVLVEVFGNGTRSRVAGLLK